MDWTWFQRYTSRQFFPYTSTPIAQKNLCGAYMYIKSLKHFDTDSISTAISIVNNLSDEFNMFIHFLLVKVLVKLNYSSTIDNVNFTFLIVTWRGRNVQFPQNKILNNSRNNISWNSVILSANSTKYKTNLTYLSSFNSKHDRICC